MQPKVAEGAEEGAAASVTENASENENESVNTAPVSDTEESSADNADEEDPKEE